MEELGGVAGKLVGSGGGRSTALNSSTDCDSCFFILVDVA